MYKLRANKLARFDNVQTLRRFAGRRVPPETTRDEVVRRLLHLNGGGVFNHRRSGYRLPGVRTYRTRSVAGRSSGDRHRFHVDGTHLGSSLRDRSIHAAKIVGLGLWIGIDLYRTHKSLLSAGNHPVAHSLD